jgi:RNA polymerase sigma-70 factor (ECF subfamily)
MLIYFKGLTQEEVAQHLKTPLGTIKSRQRSAILALRKIYAT